MKKYFDLKYSTLATWLTPVMLRTALFNWLQHSCVAYIEYLHTRFARNRENNLYHLRITPQVCFMEMVLNDRFDLLDRRIYISDGLFYDQEYIYTEAEAIDQYLFTDSEKAALYIYASSEVGAESADFIVNVPKTISFNESEMMSVIDIYKLASKKAIINKF